MSKVVERLRREAKYAADESIAYGFKSIGRCAPEETYQWLAADEIERLEAEVERLKNEQEITLSEIENVLRVEDYRNPEKGITRWGACMDAVYRVSRTEPLETEVERLTEAREPDGWIVHFPGWSEMHYTKDDAKAAAHPDSPPPRPFVYIDPSEV